MKVVILCGGLGTRLREETEFRPKPMVPVGGWPMLWHIMKYYAHFGHKDFILRLGFKGKARRAARFLEGAFTSVLATTAFDAVDQAFRWMGRWAVA